ncbi:Hypothetical protein DEACI_4160 [Acididesulfobacillus acetoxydans]|uniref:Uncharacterized protein n=1 Tax=Acididesulfobacillus acetoxydans TaxID=1561005 RepID=A0A8S0Y0N8_9FIRM|nr:Hypothetical protein DEACI_4160 [Acididesulfobacillus acetoxydans]CEJ09156.1 Hypothetical protein DEACI_3639 [Acididesulfobacillus acetoxydans]
MSQLNVLNHTIIFVLARRYTYVHCLQFTIRQTYTPHNLSTESYVYAFSLFFLWISPETRINKGIRFLTDA